MIARAALCATALWLVTGCSFGTRAAVVVGPLFADSGAGVALSVEVSPMFHSRPGWTSAGTGRLRLSREVGLAATAAAGGMWHSDAGVSASGTAGLDLVPILHTHAHRDRIAANLMVGFGGHVGYAIGQDGGAGIAAVPRLWFEASFWERGLSHYTLGGMFRCQLAFDTDLPSACGPAVIGSRIRLRGTITAR